MAFFSKAGNILKQSVSKHINKEISASKPSLMQMIRCMSSSKVFVGGLSYNTDETGLRDAFAMYGEVYDGTEDGKLISQLLLTILIILAARVIVDRETQRSRGFGFVTFATPEDASAAIQALDGKELHGRIVRVNYANDNSRPSFGGGGGYAGGGGGAYGGRYAGGGGGGGGSYGSNSYGGGSYGGGDGYDNGGGSYGGGSVNSYGTNQNIGGVGSDGSYASGGYDGFGQTGSDQLGGSESGSFADTDVGFGQEGNFREGDDEADGYANKRA
ncbi:hypothetical protein RJ639_030666 [Escallonia herrerae]|uniref:RRM domain-containing protein n=1 Tax=Escallonia herrerae TaxID=1293975 RepID=A0AA88X1P0_9ASTE|nr:hypothetical protein RJ639_030666 [Escallonia herrerae]